MGPKGILKLKVNYAKDLTLMQMSIDFVNIVNQKGGNIILAQQ